MIVFLKYLKKIIQLGVDALYSISYTVCYTYTIHVVHVMYPGSSTYETKKKTENFRKKCHKLSAIGEAVR